MTTTGNNAKTASVEVLTAEVRVLIVGGKQGHGSAFLAGHRRVRGSNSFMASPAVKHIAGAPRGKSARLGARDQQLLSPVHPINPLPGLLGDVKREPVGPARHWRAPRPAAQEKVFSDAPC